MVILYTFPYASNGVTLSSLGGTSASGVATLASTLKSVAVPSGAQIPIEGAYMYPSTISDATLATAAITVTYGTSTSYVLGATISYTDGRKHLEFYVDQATWAFYPVIFGNVWLEWVSNGLFVGLRRVELNAHMDDIYMATGMWDLAIADEGDVTYRLTPSDLQSVLNWQNSLNARLTAGSKFVLTFPFNGATVSENGGYTKDALYLYSKTVRDNFFWESHTWDHPELDNLTYAEVLAEFTQNYVAANNLFDNTPTTNPHFSFQSCITPSISGLFNGQALKAMWDFGIRNVVGDNSRPELVPTNVYHGITTNVATHGFAGIYIVPRHATNIYYDASLPDDEVSQYNYRYYAYWGRDFTIADIIADQVNSHTMLLLSYRQDPFMFHQANLRFSNINGASRSLLSYWADELATNVMKFSTLPIVSHNHDNLAQIWKDRETRDNCGITGQLKMNGVSWAWEGMLLNSTASCRLAVTGASAATSTTLTMEQYGPDSTMWITMQPKTQAQITFTTPVKQV